MNARHQTVLDHLADDARTERVVFTREPDEPGDLPDVYYLRRDLWEGLGSPERITLAVLPYDALNQPGPQAQTVTPETVHDSDVTGG